MTFQIHALSPTDYAPLFDLSDAELATQMARRVTVTDCPGTPCRVSLEDAPTGETVLLLNHSSLPEGSPFHARHAIFVRQDVAQAAPAPGVVPQGIASRLVSVRGFDGDQMMITAEVLEGVDLAPHLDTLFTDPKIAEVHIHNARQGCFAARATRAD